MIALDTLAAALRRLPAFAGLTPGDLEPLASKGIAHDHIRVRGHDVILRIPNAGQIAIPPERYIPYQAESFARARPSGHVPALIAALPPTDELPLGLLVIEEIRGKPPAMPRELPNISACLAAIHSLPVPHPAERPPLVDHADPIAGTLDFIANQATFLDKAGVIGAARATIIDEIDWACAFAAENKGRDHPVTLVATDTHPGNYIVNDDGAAILVDVEKMLYGAPGIDLAHATLYTSTTWDIDGGAALPRAAIQGFYRDYLQRIDRDLARRQAPWLLPLRRLTWLRTTTWAARYRVETLYKGKAGDPQSPYVKHVTERIADFLDADTMARVRREWLGPNPLELNDLTP